MLFKIFVVFAIYMVIAIYGWETIVLVIAALVGYIVDRELNH